jgi:hypothetical protein
MLGALKMHPASGNDLKTFLLHRTAFLCVSRFFAVGFIWHCKRFNDSHFCDISTSFLGYSKDFV